MWELGCDLDDRGVQLLAGGADFFLFCQTRPPLWPTNSPLGIKRIFPQLMLRLGMSGSLPARPL